LGAVLHIEEISVVDPAYKGIGRLQMQCYDRAVTVKGKTWIYQRGKHAWKNTHMELPEGNHYIMGS